MKKNEAPHNLNVSITCHDKSISGKCSCVAGLSGYCQHVIGLLFYVAHCKQLALKSLPYDLTCISMQQRWSIPRGRQNISQKAIQDVLVKKPQAGADYSKFIKSTLYSPSSSYGTFVKETFAGLEPEPLLSSLVPLQTELESMQYVQCMFGSVPKGSVLSYQQKMSKDYVLNNFMCTDFPKLPLNGSGNRFQNNLLLCLHREKSAMLDSIQVDMTGSLEVQERTVTQSDSDVWHLLRKSRITASKFGIVAKRLSKFEVLVQQLRSARNISTAPMRRGIEMEASAAMTYANSAKSHMVNLLPSGLIIHPKSPWLGCSPDWKVYDQQATENDYIPFGLLEIKVVKEGEKSFDNVVYLEKTGNLQQYKLKRKHIYHYQVQCQLALTGLDWCDFFCYIDDSTYLCERIKFDAQFFQDAKDKVDMFYLLSICNDIYIYIF